MAWNAFKANPLFGLGYGKFATEWHMYYDKGNSRLGIGMDDGNHSTVLDCLPTLDSLGPSRLEWCSSVPCSCACVRIGI